MTMKITSITEKTIPIASPMRNAVIDFSAMTISIVCIRTDVQVDGQSVLGYGFNSNGRYGQSGILRERIIPRLTQADPADLLNAARDNLDPAACYNVMMRNEKPGGHGDRSVAVGTLDMAIWDVVAKVRRQPLYKLLAETYRAGQYDAEVYVYAAGGYYYPGKDHVSLREELKRYLDMGFDTCKIKIGGATLEEDLRRIEASLDVVGRGQALAVDANGRFDVPQAERYARALAPYGLKWYEEPVDPLDYAATAAVSEISKTPLATGENLFSVMETTNLLRYGGLNRDRDFLQMDPALGYGLTEYLRILDMLQAKGWSVRRCIPHGGHQFGVHIAAGMGLYGNEAYPDVFVPFGEFARGMDLQNGKVRPPEAPGIGLEENPNIYRILKTL